MQIFLKKKNGHLRLPKKDNNLGEIPERNNSEDEDSDTDLSEDSEPETPPPSPPPSPGHTERVRALRDQNERLEQDMQGYNISSKKMNEIV